MRRVIEKGGGIIPKSNTPRCADRQEERQKSSDPIQRDYLCLTFEMEPVHSGRHEIGAILRCKHYSTFEQQACIRTLPVKVCPDQQVAGV